MPHVTSLVVKNIDINTKDTISNEEEDWNSVDFVEDGDHEDSITFLQLLRFDGNVDQPSTKLNSLNIANADCERMNFSLLGKFYANTLLEVH